MHTDKRLEDKTTRAIAEEARNAGICSDWLDRILTTRTADTLVDMYYRGMDFCLRHQFPSVELFRAHDLVDVARQAGIFVEGEHRLGTPGMERLAVRGGATVYIGTGAGAIFQGTASEGARLSVRADEGATLFLDVYDLARLDVLYSDKRPPRLVYIKSWGGAGQVFINKSSFTRYDKPHPPVRIVWTPEPYPLGEEISRRLSRNNETTQ